MITAICGVRRACNKSLFGTVDWDGKLGVTVTMRNWTTALKLLEISA